MRTLEFGLRGRICALAVALVAALCCCVLCVGGVQQAWADGASDANGESAAADVLGAPAHSKTLAQGDDGNWYLTLDVTGKSQSVSGKTKANVVVVLDTSGSMLESDVKSFEYKSASPGSWDTKYGKVGDEYVRLHWKMDGSYYYYTPDRSRVVYDVANGLFVREETTSTRIAVAKSAVEELTDSLLGLNTEENPDAVQMALVTFNRKANVASGLNSNGWLTDPASFKTALGSVDAQSNTGTNWEDALCTANGIQGDSDPTYVVFVSDGNPTLYNYNNENGYAGSGSGYDQTAYDKAAVQAKEIVAADKSFYAVAAFGNAGGGGLNARMQSLVNAAYSNKDVPSGHCFNATDHEGLESAFSSIVADITKDYSYTNVKITDVMSEYVDVVVPEGATQLDFIYKKDGVIWTASEGAPSAEYRSDDATVIWDLSSLGTLEDGVTYSVTFPVRLNQNAYDTVADLTNDGSLYSEESCPRIKKNDDGSYSVCTNSSATLDYVSQRIVGGGDPEEVGESPATYESPVMPVPVSMLTIVKSWGSIPAGFEKESESVVVVVKQSDVETAYATKTLEASNSWTGTVYVPAGEARTYAVSETWGGSNSAWSTTYKVDGASAGSASVEFAESPTALSHTVAVTNAYSASGSLGGDAAIKIEAKKTLTGRDLKAGEFSFSVMNGDAKIVSAENKAGGSIDFPEISYTTESVLGDVKEGKASVSEGSYVYQYTVAEDTADLAGKGVTAMVSSFTITVALTDDGKGKLTPSVTYPEGMTSLEFKNQYGSSDGVSLVLAGSKNLSFAEGLNPPSIAGKYTFTLNGLYADSMTANNDAAGNVSFSAITYTMDDLKEVEADESGARTKEFAYTVAESGKVEGVANDKQSSKTVTVTLTDDGKGNLTAVVNPSSFTFTNTYRVEPTESSLTGDGKVSIEKVLTGRDLVDGEFGFQLKSADGTVVAEGANDAEGKVSMGSVKFSKPDTYSYTLSEVEGDAERVSYDPAEYAVTAEVSDNGDGTMGVVWTVAGEDGAPLEKVVFENAYEPEVVPPATPVVPEPDDGDDDADASDEPASSDDGKQVLAKTGDSSPLLLLTAIAGAAVLVLVALMAMRRHGRR